ncbi:hypothetical protein [Streptomyces katsurahamanus]|uniref:DUF4360 domain-containing protein n=1 Tax=Streptomyces katsurahamanus TaxID=2577098 RepID=A0ABW9NRD8_9ACTN|nr:hypothetical protein [Streptomyces katsurahamanus]MQS35454.1 hypothetical protein [Streptomyces katsurahamanus]
MGTMRILRALARPAVALLAGAALALSTPGAAHATTTYEIPAPTSAGISATVRIHDAVVPQPYDPDPSAVVGPRRCGLLYHEYVGTAGCGGFELSVTLHNVRSQPGFAESGPIYETVPIVGPETYRFHAFADLARTFRCLRPDGTFDPATTLVVRTPQRQLDDVYFYTEVIPVLAQFQRSERDYGPLFYMNFDPVQVNCPSGTTAHQYGLKISNIKITVNTPYIFGGMTWTHPGPYYA